MISQAVTAFLMAVDSVVAAMAIGPFVRDRASRTLLATWLGLCDAAATAIGATQTASGPLGICLAGLTLAACAVLLLRWPAEWRPASRGVIAALAVACSVDNLVAASPLEPGAAAAASGCTLVATGTLAYVGLALGSRIAWGPALHPLRASGAGLAAAAVVTTSS